MILHAHQLATAVPICQPFQKGVKKQILYQLMRKRLESTLTAFLQ